MILAVVKGNVVSTNKTEKLQGSKLLIVEEWNIDTKKASGQPLVAVDLVGAGEGELVMCVKGSSARQTEQTDKRPVDMAIIGIVDQAEMDGSIRYRKYPPIEEKADKAPAAAKAEAAPAPAPAPASKPVPAAPAAAKSAVGAETERLRKILNAGSEQHRAADTAAQPAKPVKKPAHAPAGKNSK